jgi:hypothetical protein
VSCNSLAFPQTTYSGYTLSNRTAPLPLVTSTPNFASIARVTCEIIGRVSGLLYFVAEVSLELPVPLAAWVACTV